MVKKFKVKVLEVNADAERVSLSIKLLKSVQLQEEGQKKEKSAARPRRPKRQEKRDFELPETQTGFSMADLFGDIRTLIKLKYTKSFVYLTRDFSFSVSFFDIIVLC